MNPDAGDADGDGADSDCDGWVDEDLVAAGDLVIVEVMVEPLGAGVQWVEVFNASGRDLALDGWEIAVDSGGMSVCVSVDAALAIPAGELALLCASGADVGGAACGYDWADNAWTDFSATCPAAAAISLATADTLSLSVAGTLVDAVAWDATFPVRAGRSMELRAAALDATSNDDAASWCAADTGAAYDTGNAGTPGAGPSCP